MTGIDNIPMSENTIMLSSVDLVSISATGLNTMKNGQNEI